MLVVFDVVALVVGRGETGGRAKAATTGVWCPEEDGHSRFDGVVNAVSSGVG